MKLGKEFDELKKEIRRAIKIYIVFWFLMVIAGLIGMFFILRR